MNLILWKKTKKERGLTYKDIARESGLPLGTIKNIFAGYTPDPRESTIMAIERALGVESHIGSTATPILSDNEKKLLTAFKRLPPDLQVRAIAYVQGLDDAINGPARKYSPGK